MTITLLSSDFEQGTINASGADFESSTIIRTDYIPVPNSKAFTFVIDANYTLDSTTRYTMQYVPVLYNSSKVRIDSFGYKNVGAPHEYDGGDVAYVRLVICFYNQNPAMTPEKLRYCNLSFNWWQLDLSTADKDIHTDDAPSIPYALDAPYPDICWYLNNEGNDLINNAYRECEYAFKHPFPYIIWYVNDSEDDVIHDGTPVIEEMGAGMHAVNLNTVTIPKTVTSIGRYAFTNSNISTVQIANNCSYETTSFPEGCTVTFYPT